MNRRTFLAFIPFLPAARKVFAKPAPQWEGVIEGVQLERVAVERGELRPRELYGTWDFVYPEKHGSFILAARNPLRFEKK